MKLGVVEQLGETALLLPELVNQGLSANDRLNYSLTLLQAAIAPAEQPQLAFSNLRIEREAGGVEDVSLDDVVGRSRRAADGLVALPGASRLRALLFDVLNAMLQPVEAAPAEPRAAADAASFRRGLERLAAAAPLWPRSPANRSMARTPTVSPNPIRHIHWQPICGPSWWRLLRAVLSEHHHGQSVHAALLHEACSASSRTG